MTRTPAGSPKLGFHAPPGSVGGKAMEITYGKNQSEKGSYKEILMKEHFYLREWGEEF